MNDFSHVAVIIPCLNEAQTIQKVITDHLFFLPGAQIYVFDNNSTDDTALRALEAGAKVIPSPKPGKGHVVRQMFSQIEASVFLMVDGDDTYPAQSAEELIRLVDSGRADMAVGNRLEKTDSKEFRPLHFFGNTMITGMISLFFSRQLKDVLSGYRAFSRRFVKTVPLMSQGFEVETELTLQSISKGFLLREIPIPYRDRPQGSESKLSTFRDGALIVKSLLMIFKNYRPFLFFSAISVLFALLSLAAGSLPIYEYFTQEYVHRVPLAILATGLGILSIVFLAVALILDSIVQYQKENFELLTRLIQKEKHPPLKGSTPLKRDAETDLPS